MTFLLPPGIKGIINNCFNSDILAVYLIPRISFFIGFFFFIATLWYLLSFRCFIFHIGDSWRSFSRYSMPWEDEFATYSSSFSSFKKAPYNISMFCLFANSSSAIFRPHWQIFLLTIFGIKEFNFWSESSSFDTQKCCSSFKSENSTSALYMESLDKSVWISACWSFNLVFSSAFSPGICHQIWH